MTLVRVSNKWNRQKKRLGGKEKGSDNNNSDYNNLKNICLKVFYRHAFNEE